MIQIDALRCQDYAIHVAETTAHGIGVPETHGAQEPRQHISTRLFCSQRSRSPMVAPGGGPFGGAGSVCPVRQPRSVATTPIGVGGWRYPPHTRSRAMANSAHGARTRTSAASTPESPNACVIRFPSPLSEPVAQARRRGKLPRSIPRIPTILRERRYAEFQASHQTDEQRRDDLKDALSQDYIRIVRRADGTRSVSLAGRYMDDHEYAAEALQDVLDALEERYGVRPPQVGPVRPSTPVLAFAKWE